MKLSIEDIRRVFSFIPCLAIINCSDRDFETCGASKSTNKPCWTFEHFNNFSSFKNCREYEVYNSFNHCETVKIKLVELIYKQNFYPQRIEE